ncbi:hypothetical protein [Thermosporothrix hazakensis]|nr:hypothetical protein [Thermosporothrix hazakensis]BBH88255.1 hypothetical protein KTC_30060 [Thermosporothrix sp. COM3]GCE46442.1 hypothetical protein KTH_13110 [Thermosporothrix hazakensis]
MRKRLRAALFPVFLMVLLFAACGGPREGTIPRGTPDTGSGTPAIQPTPTPKLEQAPENSKGDFYAFVRQNQLWAAQNGQSPTQVTSFNFSQNTMVFWQMPLWSADHRYLAFAYHALPYGIGGGGCPGPDYAGNGSLYVYDFQKGQATAIRLPKIERNASLKGEAKEDYWNFVSWEDASHLLAWYNGVTGKKSDDAGLYRYDVESQKLEKVLSQSTIGATPVANPQQGKPTLLNAQYSQGQFYVQVVDKPGANESSVGIYRYSLSNPEKHEQVLNMGHIPWCANRMVSAFVHPGWSVSPDGKQLAVQVLKEGRPGKEASEIQIVNLENGEKQGAFAGVPATFLARDVDLSWSPDNKKLVATAYMQMGQEQGPFLISLDNPGKVQTMTPSVAGQVSWRADSEAFAMQSFQQLGMTTFPDTYIYYIDASTARTLEKNARVFSWG